MADFELSAAEYQEYLRSGTLPSGVITTDKIASGGPKRSKYGNHRTEVNGITFDSKAEAARYGVLLLRQQAGEIASLTLQPRFPLAINGVKLGAYVGDFQYVEAETGRVVVEDVKSTATMTPVYRLKKKLMKALYGMDITEVLR